MSRLVYIAGPYTKPDPCENTNRAVEFGHRLWDLCQANQLDWFPVVPHLSHFWHTMRPRPYQDWLDIDLAMLDRCAAVIRLPGESSGADGEIARAETIGIPIWYYDPVTGDDDEVLPFVIGWLDGIARGLDDPLGANFPESALAAAETGDLAAVQTALVAEGVDLDTVSFGWSTHPDLAGTAGPIQLRWVKGGLSWPTPS